LLKEGRAKGIAGWKEAKEAAVIKFVKTVPLKRTIKVPEHLANQQHAPGEVVGRMTGDSLKAAADLKEKLNVQLLLTAAAHQTIKGFREARPPG